MAPLPDVPGVFRLKYQFQYGSDTNVLCHLYYAFATPSAFTTADMQAFTNLARSAYVTNCKSLMTNQVTLRTVTGTDLTTKTAIEVYATGSDAGSRALSSFDASRCVLTNFKVPRRYKGGHPRVYWPWGNSSDTSDPQHWSASFVSLCQTGINALNAALTGFTSPSMAGGQLASVSYFGGGGLRPTPLVDYVIAITVNPIPASQRRRLRP